MAWISNLHTNLKSFPEGSLKDPFPDKMFYPEHSLGEKEAVPQRTLIKALWSSQRTSHGETAPFDRTH
jgi:hypothetical protein